MKVIQANCRIQFTPGDIDFIASVLGKKPTDAQYLTSLLTDENSRDTILDDESLFRAVTEYPGCLRVSDHLYFYVIVRRVLRRTGIDGRSVADYVAEVLCEFSRIERTRCILPGRVEPIHYLFEMIAALESADERTSFYIRTHIGNHSLFWSGVFPEHIRHRAESRGGPGMKYYEALGQTHFRAASDHRLAERYALGPVLATLAEHFQAARLALNDAAQRIFSIGDPELPLELQLQA